MLIFLHIPKTGGSTLTPVLDWNYKQQTYKISLHKNVQKFIDLSAEEKQHYQVLIGQIYYGIHTHIPDESQYITILRHPIDRLISQLDYLNIRRVKLGEKELGMSMEWFLEHEPFQAYTQLNVIAGGNDIEDALKRPLDSDTLERDFPIVGTIKKYDESLILMKNYFGWGRAFYKRTNTNTKRRQLSDFTPETQTLIKRACEPEMELFEYAQKRLQTQLDAQDEQFWQDVAHLRKTNQRFSRLHTLAEPLRQTPLWNLTKRLLQNL